MKSRFALLAFLPALLATTAVPARSASAADDTIGAVPVANTADPSVDGAFETLSPGNRKIVDAIYESQFGSDQDMNGVLLSRDEIAAMKSGTGWGNLYKQLRSQGYTTERNLGQAISAYKHQPPPPLETGTVITTATGESFSAAEPGNSRGTGAGTRGGKAHGVKASGMVDGGSGTSGSGGISGGTGHGGGLALGHARSTVITTAAGPGSLSSPGGNGHGRGGAKTPR